MLSHLRERIIPLLSGQNTCVISVANSGQPLALPVRCSSDGLEINCLLPRWADLTYYVCENPNVLLVIELSRDTDLCWIQVSGVASPVTDPDWGNLLPKGFSRVDPNDLFSLIRVKPRRIDLVDANSKWGVSETLELGFGT